MALAPSTESHQRVFVLSPATGVNTRLCLGLPIGYVAEQKTQAKSAYGSIPESADSYQK